MFASVVPSYGRGCCRAFSWIGAGADIRALRRPSMEALGMVETKGLIGAIEAADA